MSMAFSSTRIESAERTDARRVAPISACVLYQIDRVKSRFEAMGRTVMPGICALMGATRPEATDKIAVYRVKSSISSLF